MKKTNIHNGFRVRLRWARLGWFLFTLLITACGFHLRGMIAFPTGFNHVAIINQTQHISRDLILSLQRQLREHKINVVDDPNQAQYWLILEQDSLAQQLTNVAASTTPRQYQLIYTVQFQLAQAQGLTLVPPQAVSIQRQATVNNDRILGSDYETQTIAREIYQDAATQILTRISSRLLL